MAPGRRDRAPRRRTGSAPGPGWSRPCGAGHLPQVDQHQRGVAGLQLRRQRAAHVADAGEGRDDQAHRRGDLFAAPSWFQRVRIDSESLPTGTLMPSAGHSSMPTAFTVSYSAASSPGSPQAAIQLQLSLTRQFDRRGQQVGDGLAHRHAARPARQAASGVRSPMLMARRRNRRSRPASPRTSATGTCRGRPSGRGDQAAHGAVADGDEETLAGHGRVAQHVEARPSPANVVVSCSGAAERATRLTSRCMRGGLPSSTSIGMSIGVCRRCRGSSSTSQASHRWPRRPRERAALALAIAGTAAALRRAPPARSAPGSRCTRSRFGQAVSPAAPLRRSRRAPLPAPSTSSGNALLMPPAPTSWMARIGLARPSPSAQQWLMTSCARRWISRLPRCTESKSSSAAVRAGGHRTGRAAAHADAHAGPPRAG